MNTSTALGSCILLFSIFTTTSMVFAGENQKGRGTGPIVFVEMQQLYYDSIVIVEELPPRGKFQQLFTEGGLSTEFGPGDVGYLGGRWWIDVNGDTFMDENDMYFLCPLLGPGRDTE